MSEKEQAKIQDTRYVTRNGVSLKMNLVKGNKKANWQFDLCGANTVEEFQDFFGDEASLIINSAVKHWLNIIQGREGAEYLLKKLEGEGKFFGRSEGSSTKNKDLLTKIDSMKELLKSKGMTDEEIDAYLSTPKDTETTAPETTAEVDEDELDAETVEDIAEDAEETAEDMKDERELAIA